MVSLKIVLMLTILGATVCYGANLWIKPSQLGLEFKTNISRSQPIQPDAPSNVATMTQSNQIYNVPYPTHQTTPIRNAIPMKLCSTSQRSNNVVSPTDYEAIGNDVENGSSELPEENKTNSDEDNTAALSEKQVPSETQQLLPTDPTNDVSPSVDSEPEPEGYIPVPQGTVPWRPPVPPRNRPRPPPKPPSQPPSQPPPQPPSHPPSDPSSRDPSTHSVPNIDIQIDFDSLINLFKHPQPASEPASGSGPNDPPTGDTDTIQNQPIIIEISQPASAKYDYVAILSHPGFQQWLTTMVNNPQQCQNQEQQIMIDPNQLPPDIDVTNVEFQQWIRTIIFHLSNNRQYKDAVVVRNDTGKILALSPIVVPMYILIIVYHNLGC